MGVKNMIKRALILNRKTVTETLTSDWQSLKFLDQPLLHLAEISE